MFVFTCEKYPLHITSIFCFIQELLLHNDIVSLRDIKNLYARLQLIDAVVLEGEGSVPLLPRKSLPPSAEQQLKEIFLSTQKSLFNTYQTKWGAGFEKEAEVKGWFVRVAKLIVEISKGVSWNWGGNSERVINLKNITENIAKTGARFTTVKLANSSKYIIAVNEPSFLESELRQIWNKLLYKNRIISFEYIKFIILGYINDLKEKSDTQIKTAP